MIVLSVLARKGGVGKSTAARCIAIEALKAGKSTVLIDSDPQPTCYRWGQRRIAAGIPLAKHGSIEVRPIMRWD